MTTYYLHNNQVVRDTADCPGAGLYCRPTPVVVIDPGCSQVELDPLWLALRDGRALQSRDNLRAALRHFIKTPSEPTDPAARVTDRRESIWRLLADGDWVCTSGPDVGEYLVWSRLSAERGPLTVEVPQ